MKARVEKCLDHQAYTGCAAPWQRWRLQAGGRTLSSAPFVAVPPDCSIALVAKTVELTGVEIVQQGLFINQQVVPSTPATENLLVDLVASHKIL